MKKSKHITQNVVQLAVCLVVVAAFALFGVHHTLNGRAEISGDLNGDGVVNIFDLGMFLGDYGKSGADYNTDFNGDEVVNIFDLGKFLGYYGKTIQAPSKAPFAIGTNTIESGIGSRGRDDTISHIKDMGASWVRINLVWPSIQPNAPAAGQACSSTAGTNFAAYDDYITKLRAANIDVLVTISGVPGWAQSATSGYPDLTKFSNFACMLATHYQGKILGYQPFNEVNAYPGSWNSTTYSDLLTKAYPVFKAADPNAQVVTAGMAYDLVNAPGFMQRVVARGGGTNFDVLAIHVYPLVCKPPSPCQNIETYITSFHNTAPSKQIWVTETGHSTNTGHSYQEQADYAKYYLPIMAKYKAYVTRVVWYELFDHYGGDYAHNPADLAADQAEKEYNFGTYDVYGNPKPVRDVLLQFEAGNLN
jgi:hypothetical protein